MDRDEKVDPMDVNISNVFSLGGKTYTVDKFYDVDFSENGGNPLIESIGDYFLDKDKKNYENPFRIKKFGRH